MENKNSEKIKLIAKYSRKKNIEQKILSDLKELDFSHNLETNKNYPFNEVLDFIEKRGYFLLFISLLKNEFSKKFLELLKKQCPALDDDKLSSKFDTFLDKIAKCEKYGKEYLLLSKNTDFSEVFFNYNLGNDSNIHGILNINFTEHTQCLNVNAIFERETIRVAPIKCQMVKLILYDNGHKAVIIEKDSDKENYFFTPDSSCQLIINRFNENDVYTVTLDITSSKLINVELKINDKKENPLKILNLISHNETFLIESQNLSKILTTYFDNENPRDGDLKYVQRECLPIKSLNDLKNWKPPSVKHMTVPLKKRAIRENQIKTLVCHDMKGGYLEDRYIDGVSEENCFFFVHWAAVDIFGYFSHHLISIPPCSWISAAHINGVQVIGTFITEWDEGAKVCDNIFAEKKSVDELCKQLVNIAAYYNFDGWLINIENEVKPFQIPSLKYFLKTLTTQMHAYIPGSQVIWYDSVLKNGDLSWQSCLNELNRVFFLNADAIFLNYNWNEEKLLLSKLHASDRYTEVYVGVDVFGRGNCFTEGGFSTDISVKEAMKHGLSVAIFAPGWVYECLEVKEFKENQFKFWNSLQELIPPRKFGQLPFSSSFCPGFGAKVFRNGKVIHDEAWFNVNLQQPQPIYCCSSEAEVALHTEDAFCGGGCLRLSGCIISVEEALMFNILKTSFCLENTCLLSYTFKPLVQNMDVGLCLDMLSSQERYKLYLVDSKSEVFLSSDPSVKYLTPTHIDEIVKTGYKVGQKSFEQENWIKRVYVLNSNHFSYHSIQSISVVASCKNAVAVSVLFGELEVLPVHPTCNLVCEDLTCKCASDDPKAIDVECILKWQCPSENFRFDIYLQPLNEDRQYVCTTNQNFYNFKSKVNLTSEITIILCPKRFGIENLPDASVKIPLKM